MSDPATKDRDISIDRIENEVRAGCWPVNVTPGPFARDGRRRVSHRSARRLSLERRTDDRFDRIEHTRRLEVAEVKEARVIRPAARDIDSDRCNEVLRVSSAIHQVSR